VYKLVSIGTLLRNSGAPAGVRSEFRHAQVRLLDSNVKIGATAYQSRKIVHGFMLAPL